jgi:hypothetical protein
MLESAFHDPLRRLRAETAWLQKEFIQAATSSSNRQTQLACEMAVIRLHDGWARFCRELVVLSAFGHTVTLGGLWLSPSNVAITNRSLVVPVLLSTYKKKRIFEPEWGDANKCVDAASRLSIMNLSTVAAALGAINSPADEIRRVRNFCAHRKKGTAMNVAATNLFSTPTRPMIFELAGYTSGGSRIIESWVTGLIIVATAAAQ